MVGREDLADLDGVRAIHTGTWGSVLGNRADRGSEWTVLGICTGKL